MPQRLLVRRASGTAPSHDRIRRPTPSNRVIALATFRYSASRCDRAGAAASKSAPDQPSRPSRDGDRRSLAVDLAIARSGSRDGRGRRAQRREAHGSERLNDATLDTAISDPTRGMHARTDCTHQVRTSPKRPKKCQAVGPRRYMRELGRVPEMCPQLGNSVLSELHGATRNHPHLQQLPC